MNLAQAFPDPADQRSYRVGEARAIAGVELDPDILRHEARGLAWARAYVAGHRAAFPQVAQLEELPLETAWLALYGDRASRRIAQPHADARGIPLLELLLELTRRPEPIVEPQAEPSAADAMLAPLNPKGRTAKLQAAGQLALF